ncbi:MAG: 50S ribosomal protein L10, partial [Clostridia bacterium]|nr:50S ribosomal protein L10 [Clostridia bacterium]
MPNAKVLSEKQAIVEGLAKRMQEASAGVLIDYKGITVAQDSKLRRELSQNDVEYSVVKNTLTKFAVEKIGLG